MIGPLPKNRKSELDELGRKIAEILHANELSKAQQFKKFCDTDNTCVTQNMWKLKKQLWPKRRNTLPTAKYNHKRMLVSSPRDIKAALFQEYKERLRKRKIRPDFIKQKYMDNCLVNLKLNEAKKNKSNAFDMKELNKALGDLNKGRARDPEGLCAELFQPSVIGDGLKDSLLIMLNKIKREGKVPPFTNVTSVTTIPKEGPKLELINERGIFNVSILRTIILRLIYNRYYNIIDSNMSESNIGASCRNHIWILNGINFEHSKSIKSDIIIQFYDYSQMFDSMVLSEALKDMHSVGMDDDLLILLKELNTNVTMTVNTPYGQTDEIKLPAIVAQGDLMSPLISSVHIDTMGKEQLKNYKDTLYKYKNKVPIPILSMMDDTAAVTNAGYKATLMNTFINTHTADKMLHFNGPKSKFMKIGKDKETIIDQPLEIDNWKVEHNKNGELIEEFIGKVNMTETTEQKYLGFVISSNATNVANILSKQKKVTITSRQIMNIVKGLDVYTFDSIIIYQCKLKGL